MSDDPVLVDKAWVEMQINIYGMSRQEAERQAAENRRWAEVDDLFGPQRMAACTE